MRQSKKQDTSTQKKSSKKFFLISCAILIFLTLCVCLSLTFTGLYILSQNQTDLRDAVKKTEKLDNYTVRYESYLRAESDDMDIDFTDTIWVDLSAEAEVDEEEWSGTLNIDTFNYQSDSAFYNNGKDYYGKIDYEDTELSKPWRKIRQGYSYYGEYNTFHQYNAFQRDEDKAVQTFTNYKRFLNLIERKNADSSVQRDWLNDDTFILEFEDDEDLIGDIVRYLIVAEDEDSASDINVEEIGEIWARVKITDGTVREIKIYFSDVVAEDEDSNTEATIEGGFTISIDEIGSTEVEKPKGI